MNCFRLLFSLSLAICLLFVSLGGKLRADDSVMPKIHSIVDECLKNIKKIQSGELTLFFFNSNEKHPSFNVQKHLDIIFDGEKMLVTHRTERTAVYAFNCYKPETLAYFRTSPPNMVGTPPPVDIDIQDFHLDALKLFHFPSYFTKRKQLNDIKKLVDSRELKVPSPIIFRYIGQRFNLIDKLNGDENDESFFTSFNKKHRKDFEDAVQDDDGGFFNYQLTEDTIDGVLCYKISRDVVNSLFADRVVSVKGRELTGKEKIEFLRTTRLKGHQIYWFDKLHGNIIRKMTMQSERISPDVNTAANYPIERELTNKLSQETKSGIWYPSSWVCSVSCAGKLERREEGIIEYKSINQPIPAERFSLENIAELRPNCPVEWNLDSPPPGKGKLIWDGKKIVGLGFDNDSYEGAKRNRHIVFIVLANVLIISSLVLIQFLRVWNRRRNDNL